MSENEIDIYNLPDEVADRLLRVTLIRAEIARIQETGHLPPELFSEEGLIVRIKGQPAGVIWLNSNDCHLVGWLGNDHDYDMTSLIMAPMPSGLTN